jgi:hypothetical protein
MPRCVITAIQPTYRGPYRDGYPSICELTLSFKDLDPLYHESEAIRAADIITVTSNEATKVPRRDRFERFTSVYDRLMKTREELYRKYHIPQVPRTPRSVLQKTPSKIPNL